MRYRNAFACVVVAAVALAVELISAGSHPGCGRHGWIAGARTGCPGVTPSTVRPLATTATPLTST